MSSRSKARKRALDLLYSAELRGQNLGDTLASAEAADVQPGSQSSGIRGYAAEIVRGVGEHSVEIDETIQSHARGWSLSRMPAVDRAILRLGMWEILHNDDVPAVVAVSEAVRLASELSTEDSAGFVNGVLGRVAELHQDAE